MNINPVSHVVTAVRDLLNEGHVTTEVGWALLGCVVVVAVFAAALGAVLQPQDVAQRRSGDPLDHGPGLRKEVRAASFAVLVADPGGQAGRHPLGLGVGLRRGPWSR